MISECICVESALRDWLTSWVGESVANGSLPLPKYKKPTPIEVHARGARAFVIVSLCA